MKKASQPDKTVNSLTSGDNAEKEEAPKDPFFYLLTIYLIPFALLLLCAEMHWTTVLKYVQFLGY